MKKLIYTLVILAFVSSVSAQWSEQTSGVTTVLYSVSAVDNNVVWVCGAGGKVLRTVNGGTTWNLTASPNSALNFVNIWSVDANTALVTGSGSTTYVYKTTNGGVNWTQVFSQANGYINAITGLTTVNNNTLFISGNPVGGRWSLWMSTNAGTTWDSAGMYIQQSGTETGYNNSLTSVHFNFSANTPTRIWFGTNNSRIYYYKYGQGWNSQSISEANCYFVRFLDTLYGLAGGSTGNVMTTNSGQAWWQGTAFPGSGNLSGFAFTQEGFYISRGSSIYFTNVISPASVWNPVYSQTGIYKDLTLTRTAPQKYLWGVRDNGGISKYSVPVGIIPISSETPSAFSLSQNYPNPFNPTTKIKFDVVRVGDVKIVVYDVMGREVQTLVNESLKPGTYEASFDGSALNSGVYFYKLVTDNFVETRKMILLK